MMAGQGPEVNKVRTFTTGATRDQEQGKFDFEGFLSPLVVSRFGEFMHANRIQKDGSVRDSDNWQKGIPFEVYMKSAWRHFEEWWAGHRHNEALAETGRTFIPWNVEEALCALLFNVQGYLHELLKRRNYQCRTSS